jgi:hypothetical protein
VQRHGELEFGPEGVALVGVDKEVLELCLRPAVIYGQSNIENDIREYTDEY